MTFFGVLTHKQLKMHVCVIRIVATDLLVLKHQAISIHSVDLVLIVLPKIHTIEWHLWWKLKSKFVK